MTVQQQYGLSEYQENAFDFDFEVEEMDVPNERNAEYQIGYPISLN